MVAGSIPQLDALLQHRERVHALARRLCADVHGRADAEQETWLAALKSPPRHRGNLAGWLERTFRNALAMSGRSERRRAKRQAEAGGGSDAFAEAAADAAERAELHRCLMAEVLALPEPQRGLVLLHYFDGVDVAALAQRAGISPDAVRALLRRARDKLRVQLERSEGPPARAFALLLAASKPVATVAGMTAATAVASGGLAIMKLKLLLGAAAAVAALCWWSWLPRSSGADADAAKAAPAMAMAVAAAKASAREPSTPEPASRSEVPLAPEAEALHVHGRLVGLHPDATWTVPLLLSTKRGVSGVPEPEGLVAVAADGTFTVTLPPSALTSLAAMRLRAKDPFYLPVDASFELAALNVDEPIAVQVDPVSVLVGRVVDYRGAAVPAARLFAFLPFPDRQAGEVFPRATCDTDPDGHYRLQLPVAAAILLLAVPCNALYFNGRPGAREDGTTVHAGHPDDDLMPASARVTSQWGRITEVPDLMLSEPAYVTGTVTDSDGKPVAGVQLEWMHTTSESPLYDRAFGNLMTWSDGTGGRITRAVTDRTGRFRLPAVFGKRGVCGPLGNNGSWDPFVEFATVTPPAEVDFHLAGGIALVRVQRAGVPLPGIGITTDSMGDRLTAPGSWRRTDKRGEMRFLCSKRAAEKIVVHVPGEADRTVDLPADASVAEPLVIDLPAIAKARVSIDLQGVVRRARFAWRRLDAGSATQWDSVERANGEGQFEFDVPPGRYEMTFSAREATGDARADAERDDTFLMTVKQEIEVPERGCELDIPIVYGGRVRLMVTRADGRFSGGVASLTGAAGRFLCTADWREVKESDNLPGGSYLLQFALPGGGQHEQTVEVQPRVVTDVRIRVP